MTITRPPEWIVTKHAICRSDMPLVVVRREPVEGFPLLNEGHQRILTELVKQKKTGVYELEEGKTRPLQLTKWYTLDPSKDRHRGNYRGLGWFMSKMGNRWVGLVGDTTRTHLNPDNLLELLKAKIDEGLG